MRIRFSTTLFLRASVAAGFLALLAISTRQSRAFTILAKWRSNANYYYLESTASQPTR